MTGKGSGACRELPIFETVKPVAAITTGWYFGSAFPNDKRIEIDKTILENRNEVQVFLDDKIPRSRCGIPKPRITPEVIGWLLLSVVLLCLVPIGFAVITAILLRRKVKISTDGMLLGHGSENNVDEKS